MEEPEIFTCANCFNDGRKVCAGNLCPFRMLTPLQYTDVRRIIGRKSNGSLFNFVGEGFEEEAKRCILREARQRVLDPVGGMTRFAENVEVELQLVSDATFLVDRSLLVGPLEAVQILEQAWGMVEDLYPWRTARLLVALKCTQAFIAANMLQFANQFGLQVVGEAAAHMNLLEFSGLVLLDDLLDLVVP